MKCVAFLLFLSLASGIPAFAQTATAPPLYLAEIVMEPTTGTILSEQNAHQPFPVASMTKMMTLLIVMENVRDGLLTLDSPVTVSAAASKIGGSQVFLKQGEVFPLKDIIAAAMVHSANDAAYALAEKVAGSREAFVPLMNERAAKLGMKESHFYSPHGLPAEEGEPEDQMSAYDAAKLGIEVMKFPLLAELAKVKNMPFRGGVFQLRNPNHLLDLYDAATGIKTGFTNKAGFCVTASARRGDLDLVCVVMGSKQKNGDFKSAIKLFSEAFAAYTMAVPIKKGATIEQRATIKNGEVSTVPVVSGGQAKMLMKRGEQGGVTTEVRSTNVEAPIRKGQQVGTVVVKKGNQVIAQVPALATMDVGPMPWWKKWWPF
ncbi:MAG TPA: D-alanyl-D-alanine carboxypeptidase family protein [Thermoanaerobaculia bacterium]|nr:D-alanyl-D-alanine carboxypeptidase family protein [Thermoanaerobaculia bacterium]